MQVRVGWSGEIDPGVWRKADVELDDSDLFRMLIEAEVVVGKLDACEWVMDQISTKVAFQLLQAESEILLLKKLLTLGYPAVKAETRITRLENENTYILTALRSKFTDVVMA